MKEPTYEELVQLRQKEWEAAQRKAEANLAATMTQVRQMPDVKDAPAENALWSASGVSCECGNEAFRVKRWVTVNGVKYRTQLECLGCKGNRTWDFAERRWIELQRFYPDVGTRKMMANPKGGGDGKGQ